MIDLDEHIEDCHRKPLIFEGEISDFSYLICSPFNFIYLTLLDIAISHF